MMFWCVIFRLSPQGLACKITHCWAPRNKFGFLQQFYMGCIRDFRSFKGFCRGCIEVLGSKGPLRRSETSSTNCSYAIAMSVVLL